MPQHHQYKGFTIVELLIVIVVIGILTAISIVAYNGISNNANDAAVQSDLRNIGQKMTIYRSETGAWPTTQLSSLGLKVSKNAYGGHYITDVTKNYNLLYCRINDGSGDMALIASSVGGKKFIYKDGTVREFMGRWSGTLGACADAGIPIPSWEHRDWLYDNGAWKSYL